VSAAISIARAELGLDPLHAGEDRELSPQDVLDSLTCESEPLGATVECVPLERILSDMRAGATAPVMLVHENGHLHLLVGAFSLDGQLMCQVLHGDMPVSAVSKEQLAHAGFREAWRLSGDSTGAPIRVGSGNVKINKLLHNFGEVFAGQTCECSFTLTNRGQNTVVVAKPTAPCTCTLLSLTENKELAAGETVELRVKVRSTNAASQRNSVSLKFFEKGTGVSRQVVLQLVASQRESMQITPDKLDFGRVAPGETYMRAVRLAEVPTDRFVLKNVELEGLPATYELETTQTKHGLTSHLVRVTLGVPEDMPSGVHTGGLHLTTDSHVLPEIRVPVRFEVAPRVTAVPSVVSLGTVPVGKPQERTVRLVARDGGPLAVTVESLPNECSVNVDDKAKPAELLVKVTLHSAGVWQGTITLKIRSGLRDERIQIKCVGYASKSS
jgi:hypothetical protein